MKILLCNSFHYLRGGAERCFFELMTLLTERGHIVIPFCMQDDKNLPSPYSDYFISSIDFPGELQKKNLTSTLKVLNRVVYSQEAHTKIARLIADTQPDLVHVHGIAHETSPSILPAIKRAGLPIVQTLHDYKLLCPNTTFVSNGQICESCKGHHYYNVVRKRCKRGSITASLLAGVEMVAHKLTQIYEKNVDEFIAPSQFLCDKVQEYGIRTPIVHIPNFIDVERFQPWYEPEDYFVYCGRLTAVKGIRTLVEAMAQLRTSHLYIAGHGELEEELKAYVDAQQLSNHITFLGHLNTPELITLIQRARFMVSPSEWYENYPMTVLEALACGTPVIGANIGGIPELVKNNETGLLFEAGNVQMLVEKINELLHDPAKAIAMGQNGRRQVVATNNAERHYHQTLAVYNKVLGRSRAQELTTAMPTEEVAHG